MPDSPSVSVYFSDVCKMSTLQPLKLSKPQLMKVLKEAVELTNQRLTANNSELAKEDKDGAVISVMNMQKEFIQKQEVLLQSFEKRFEELNQKLEHLNRNLGSDFNVGDIESDVLKELAFLKDNLEVSLKRRSTTLPK